MSIFASPMLIALLRSTLTRIKGKVSPRRGPSPLPLQSGASPRPAGSSPAKYTADSKARLSAKWPRKGKKCYKKCYNGLQVGYYQNSDLNAVGVISGRCNFASSLFGLDWVDLQLRARSVPLGPDA